MKSCKVVRTIFVLNFEENNDMVLHHIEAVRIFVFTSHRNLFSMCFKSFGFSSIAEDLYTDLDKFKTFYRTNKSKGRIIFKRHINLYLRLFFFSQNR